MWGEFDFNIRIKKLSLIKILKLIKHTYFTCNLNKKSCLEIENLKKLENSKEIKL